MSRQVYLLGWGLALVAGAFLLTDWALSLRPGVTEANLRRIRPGMTLREAEDILAFALCDYAKQPWALTCGKTFHFRGGIALVRWDANGRITKAPLICAGLPEPSPFARLRAWLGW